MTASPSELTLECKSQRYSMLLKPFGDHPAPTPLKPSSVPATATDHDDHHPTQKLEEYLARLEEERLKIDAFKRELPLCVQLLSDAMEASKQQLQSYGASQEGTQPVLEEFIPLKHSNSEGSNQKSTTKNNYNSADKANWMTTAQLWSYQASSDHDATKNQPTTPKETNISLSVCPNFLALDNKRRNGGAFLPFIKESDGKSTPTTQKLISDLALASSDSRRMEDNMCSENHDRHGDPGSRSDEISTKVMGNGIAVRNNAETQTISAATNAPATATATTTCTAQNNRKQRRCWSPELHRRFVNALQMLGGSQVATPKQIRELMQVDGLTNDEVKSHLQKYRLHTRRPISSPQSTVPAQAQQLVVLGSIWVPPEYAAAAHGGAPTIYGAHPTSQVSPHYCTPQEFYPPHSLLSQPHPRVLHQQQLQVYRTASQQVHISHDSDEVGRSGDRSGSTEEGKSENSTWKGENGVDVRKMLGGIDEEMSNNESEITLKF